MSKYLPDGKLTPAAIRAGFAAMEKDMGTPLAPAATVDENLAHRVERLEAEIRSLKRSLSEARTWIGDLGVKLRGDKS